MYVCSFIGTWTIVVRLILPIVFEKSLLLFRISPRRGQSILEDVCTALALHLHCAKTSNLNWSSFAVATVFLRAKVIL